MKIDTKDYDIIASYLSAGKLVDAIKHVRSVTGWGFKQSKVEVDHYREHHVFLTLTIQDPYEINGRKLPPRFMTNKLNHVHAEKIMNIICSRTPCSEIPCSECLLDASDPNAVNAFIEVMHIQEEVE